MASADEARGIRGHVADTSEDDASLEEMTGKKRRLSSAQVRSLEENFELEKKVEPQRKVQLARDLGLHPRQVAVWFQNRRARYKTKQLQKDYDLLRFDHETLSAEFRVLKHENEKLLAQLERLKQSLRAEDENAADVRGIIATSSPSQTGPPAVAKGRMLGPLNRLLLLTDHNAPLTPLSLLSSCNRAAPVGPALGCLTSDTESSGTLNDWNEESPHSVKYPASHVTNANGEDKFLSAPNFYHQIFSEEACNSLWDWTP